MGYTNSTFDWFFVTYASLLFGLYVFFVIFAMLAIKKNKKRAAFLNISNVKGAQQLPSVSLIAPAYNEGKSIITNVQSLLSIQYPYYELIIVNDGSKDDTMHKLVEAFDLLHFDTPAVDTPISHAPIIAHYRSSNPKYNHLTVIHKENGGRADALNCGIANAGTNLVLCTDADCIIEQDALLKLVRPYLEELDKEIIACGAAIGIANDSIIKNGTLKELKLPKGFLPRIQVVEYIRAFLLGRMAWGYVDGLLLVSGAFGLYPRSRVLEVGGFDKNTVGEDLELCIRLRVHMERLQLPYDVVYIPETLCWTEAPSTPKVYVTQRDRWARGLFETIKKHHYLFHNRKYGALGNVFFPYWVYFELLAPIIELLGIILIITYTLLGWINWPFAAFIFIAVYLVGCIFSTIAILMFTVNFRQYSNFSMVSKLLLAAYLESFTSHPIMLYAEIKGYLKKIFRIKATWGTMARQGFTTSE